VCSTLRPDRDIRVSVLRQFDVQSTSMSRDHHELGDGLALALIRSRGFIMKTMFCLSFASSLLIGCTADPSPDAVTIQIGAGRDLVFAAFRDGVDASWQPATSVSPASYQAAVHGPYLVTVVCATGNHRDTVQLGRTLDDPHDLGTLCEPAASTPGAHKVTGQMTQAGQVAFAQQLASGTSSNWGFQFSVPDGSYDLLAATADALVVRRAVAVNADTAVPAVDAAAQGMPLASAAFSAASAAQDKTEQLEASVVLATGAAGPIELYRGPIDQAKIAPQPLLMTADHQTVEIRATANTTAGATMIAAERALRRPFRAGGDTAFALPPSLGTVQWDAKSDLTATWAAQADLGSLIASGDGTSSDGLSLASCKVDLSDSFLAATAATSATCATNLPGYKPEFKIDLTRAYTRQIMFQHAQADSVATVSETESANAPKQ
jgi:hypothetical protein